MITKIELTNFQAYKHAVLDLSPSVNVIRGSSDSGKSSIIRGIRWIADNSPSGDSFIRNGQKGTEVKITLSSKDVIARGRNNKSNYYKLNDEEFLSFGTGIPKDIRESLNFSDLNMQHQIDQPFLLAESGGDVSRYLNKIVDIDDIDTTIKALNSFKKKETSDMNHIISEIKSLEEKVETFSYLDELEELIEQGEFLSAEIEDDKDSCEIIEDILAELEEVDEILGGSSFSYLEVKKDIETAIALWNEVDELDSEAGALNELIVNIGMKANSIETLAKEVKRAKKEYELVKPDTCPLCGK